MCIFDSSNRRDRQNRPTDAGYETSLTFYASVAQASRPAGGRIAPMAREWRWARARRGRRSEPSRGGGHRLVLRRKTGVPGPRPCEGLA
ncbi:hypothetical protein HMPREF0043_02203 [Actinobaculum sp. oral taxon 183 str. F0552]|nr:hypothetical protein HMPREF0043_02203 [Actinobaculum sp. oral taxon 183 str. F0552]